MHKSMNANFQHLCEAPLSPTPVLFFIIFSLNGAFALFTLTTGTEKENEGQQA